MNTDSTVRLTTRMPLVLSAIFVATAQWSGVVVASIQLSDVALVLALLYPARHAAPPRGRFPRPTGAYVLLATICISSVLAALRPPSTSYLLGRQVFSFSGTGSLGPAAGVSDAGFGSAFIVVKLALATVGAWVLVRRVLAERPHDGPILLAGSWLAGAAVSAAVATIEWSGIPVLSSEIHHTIGLRASGLAFHPDSLGLYLDTAIPLLAYFFARRSLIFPGVVLGVVLWCGLLAADSRSALLLGLAATLALPLCAVRPARAVATTAPMLLLFSPLGVAAVLYLRTKTRLAPGAGTASDVGHTIFAHQAITDFAHSPVFGIGFDNALGAPLVPAAVLASGGVISFIGYVFFWGWTYGRTTPRLADYNVRIFCVSATVVLVSNFAANNFTDRGEYVFGFAAILVAVRESLAGPAVLARPVTGALPTLRGPVVGTGARLQLSGRGSTPVSGGSRGEPRGKA